VCVRNGLAGLGLVVLYVAGFALAVMLVLLMRPLTPVILGLAIASVLGTLIWREVSARRRERAQSLPAARDDIATYTAYHGLMLAGDAALDDNHAWVRESAAGVAVGADDLALRLLGPVDTVSVAPVGSTVERGDVLFVLRRGGRALAMRSPMSGRVREHNRIALARPATINASPYEHGWIASLDVADVAGQRSALHAPPAVWSWFRSEVDRALSTLAPGGPMPAMPDGGLVSSDLHLLLDDETWQRIRAEFFEPAATERR
jgi:glycine cleavage system H lipoate-binding protein